MITDGKYAKTFVSNDMTHRKYDELHCFAVSIRDFKNQISEEVSNSLLKYLDYDRFSFLKEMRGLHKEVPSSFDAQLYTQVFECYQNKFDAIMVLTSQRISNEKRLKKCCYRFEETCRIM